MDTIVLIKQVPDTESAIEVDSTAARIVEDNLNWVLNPYDEIAVEEALRIKEAHGGKVTLLCTGPKRSQDALRSGLAMGADQAILIQDPALDDCDTRGLAQILAACIRTLEYGLILSGQRAVDDDLQLTGAFVACALDIPYVPDVTRQEIEDQTLRCRQSTDRALLSIESPLPALIAVQRGLNEPRYISLPGMMKAKKKPIDTKTLSDLGLEAANLPQTGLQIESLQIPSSQRAGEMISGDTPEEQATNLAKRLREMDLII